MDILLAADPPDLEGALFNIQQAAEKGLKGFLTWHDIPFRKTHHLAEVGGQCAEIDRTLAPLVERADELTKYAWTFRYPGSPYEATLDEARAAAALAREVFEAVLNRLPPEVHPPSAP